MSTKTLNPVLSPAELKELLAENPRPRILDVRTPGEFESVHIRGAYNVPLDQLGEHAEEIQADVTDPVILICQSGSRARKAEEALGEHAMSNLHILAGGMNGWVAAGGEVERGPERLSLERQVRIGAGALAALGGALALAVNPLFAAIPAFVGAGLIFAGVTDTCGMAMLLSKLPYNRPVNCDVDQMVRSLKSGAAPEGFGPTVRATARSGGACAG